MPFHPPFKDRFREGDLVYRFAEQRVFYFRNFGHFKSSSTQNNISTIDQYAATNFEIKLQNNYKKQKPANQENYLQALLSHPKYTNISNALGFNMNGRAAHHHQVIGRKCKAGFF